MKPLLLIAVLLATSLCPPSVGAQPEALYEASVPVPDQSADARARALRDALGAVLVKVTGDRDAPRRDELRPMLDAAPRMVQQFRYERTGEPPELRMRARFETAAVQRALIERGVATWGRERPATIAWLAYDDGTERGLVDGAAPEEIRPALADAASARGLPLLWPLLDLEDRAAVPFADLWGGFDEGVLAASERYRSNAILVGRVYRVDADRWAARWNLIDDEGSHRTDSGPGPLDEVVAEGPHWVADRFAERFALVPTAAQDGRTRLVVAGVESVGAYASVMRYLGSLSPVAGVALDAVDGDEVTFALELRGTPQQLQQAIALGARLQQLPQPIEYDLTLRYALRR